MPCDLLNADNLKAKETKGLIDEIRMNECFPQKVLLTTKILDNGINIQISRKEAASGSKKF